MKVKVKQVVIALAPDTDVTAVVIRELLDQAGISSPRFELDKKLLWEDNEAFTFDGTTEEEIHFQRGDCAADAPFETTIYLYD